METKQAYRVGIYYLTKNRDGRWCRTWYDNEAQQRKSSSLGTKDFSVAKVKLDEWFITHSTPILDDNLELSKCLLEYWNQHAKFLERSDTEKRNSRYWVKFFPNKLVREIRPPSQRKFIDHLKSQGYAKGTIESIFKTGSAAITYAWKNEMLLTPIPLISPAKHLAKYKMAKTERWRTMEINEMADLFDHAPNDRLIRFLIIMIGCACRPSAGIELHGSQIDKKAGTINLLPQGRSQTNKYRPTVRLPSFVKSICHKENLVSQSEIVPNLNNLRNREWMKAREAAGLDDLVVPSSIRHTMAKWLRSQGVEPWHASSQMGHKRKGSEITEIYAPSDPAYLQQALDAIENYFALVYQKSDALKSFKELKSYRSRCALVAKSRGES